MDYNYIQLSGPLFEQVEIEKIFPDSKYFVDCIPKTDPIQIEEEYEKRCVGTDFDLKAFINEHFEPPITFEKKRKKKCIHSNVY